MKTLFSFALSLLLAIPARAETPNEVNTVEAYWQWSQSQNTDADSVDLCLEKIYSGNEDLSICQKAISDLTLLPLNSHRREILFSLLQKIPTTKLSHQQTEFLKGLLITHPELNEETLPPKKKLAVASAIETKAWLKVLSQNNDLRKTWVSLNGQPMTLVNQMLIPVGTYQWTLVNPQSEPLVFVGTWSEFSIQVKNLKPATKSSAWMAPVKPSWMPSEHLGDLPSAPVAETTMKSPSRAWILPVVIAVAVGLVFALKDKQLSVKMPGDH